MSGEAANWREGAVQPSVPRPDAMSLGEGAARAGEPAVPNLTTSMVGEGAAQPSVPGPDAMPSGEGAGEPAVPNSATSMFGEGAAKPSVPRPLSRLDEVVEKPFWTVCKTGVDEIADGGEVIEVGVPVPRPVGAAVDGCVGPVAKPERAPEDIRSDIESRSVACAESRGTDAYKTVGAGLPRPAPVSVPRRVPIRWVSAKRLWNCSCNSKSPPGPASPPDVKLPKLEG